MPYFACIPTPFGLSLSKAPGEQTQVLNPTTRLCL